MPKRKAATSQSVAQNRRWEMTEAPSVPLLLLPGTLCDARAFGSVAHVAGAVPVDLTGHSAVDAAVDAILAAAPDRFVPVGFSLGGIVTLALARRAPDRIAAMALVATNCREVPAENHGVRRAAVTGRDPAALVGDDLWPLYVHPDRAGDAGLRDAFLRIDVLLRRDGLDFRHRAERERITHADRMHPGPGGIAKCRSSGAR